MNYRDYYELWIKSPQLDSASKNELLGLDEKQIEDRFYKDLEFGTAGIRGKLGAGRFRINFYTIGRATQAMANVILNTCCDRAKSGVAIAYDSRIMSEELSKDAASILAANGIKVYIFDELRPTPELSFIIRELGCVAGINITASHNPKEYNGYKVYWEDGAQVSPELATLISKEIDRIDLFTGVKRMKFEEAVAEGKITVLNEATDELYMKNVLAQSIDATAVKSLADSFKIIYTPFHGSGYRLVPEVLKRLGVKNILTVEEQMKPDGNFPTVEVPNPEVKSGFSLAIKMAEKEGVDLIIATDPDCDRVGIVVKDEQDGFVTMSGNQVGVLLLNYIIEARRRKGTLPENAATIKTIVSTEMATCVAARNNVAVFDVLTGFKFIGELIKCFEETEEYTYIFGFEESYGYLAGTYARDKDAVVASMLIAEMAAYYKNKGMSLYDAIEELYKKYGYFAEETVNIVMEGSDGLNKIKSVMKDLRENPPKHIAGQRVKKIKDYIKGTETDNYTGESKLITLPKSDVLYYVLEEDDVFIVRPSGTEPKIKIYLMVKSDSPSITDKKLQELKKAAVEIK